MDERRRSRDELVADIARLRASIASLAADANRPQRPLRTVRVPPPLEPVFYRAQDLVEAYFADRADLAEEGTIRISGERYILVRAASISVEFFDLVTSLYQDKGPDEARVVASNLLFDVAHSLGRADARTFHSRMKVTDPIERLSAGPIHFSHAGWAFVDVLPESLASPDQEFVFIYDHPFSFEADAWTRDGRRTDFPVCVMSAGYSSGWCEESFGVPLVAAEVECVAQGDAHCRFVMAPPARIEERIAEHVARQPPSAHPASWSRAPRSIAVPEYFQRKRLEEALRESRDELERRVQERTAELEALNAALRAEMQERMRAEAARQQIEGRMQQARRLESLGVMAGGIAHDFNNLLVGILGNASILLDQVSADSPMRQALEQIETSAQRAGELTRQLLTSAGRGRFVVEAVSLTALARETAALLGRRVAPQATLTLELAAGLHPVEGDATQLRQLVMNLIANASDALGDAPGSIFVRTGTMDADRHALDGAYASEGVEPGRFTFIEVCDTGCGMDPATVERIFEPFFSTKFKGRGLGLAAALGIVRAHHGALVVETAAGRGSCFRVLLPYAEHLVPDQTTDAPRPARLGPLPVTGAVLVVDDEESVRQVVRTVLEHIGVPVVECADGLSALEVFRGRHADIGAVVLDITMPGLGGLEVLPKLRQLAPRVPVLLISGHSEHPASRQPSEPGVGFIAKPFRPAELLQRLRDVLPHGSA